MQQTERIAAIIRDEISRGVWSPGTRLPSEKLLGERFDVAPGTVRVALRTLVEEGCIDGTRGARKTVIGRPAAPDPFEQFRSFAQWAKQQGRVAGGAVYSKRWVPARRADAEALSVALEDPVLYVTRLRSLDGGTVMVERTHYRESVGVVVETLADDCASVTIALAAEAAIEFARAQHVFTAVAAEPEDAELLDVAVGSPLLAHRRVSFDRSGVALEWSDDRYRHEVIGVAVGSSWAVNPLRWITDPEGMPEA